MLTEQDIESIIQQGFIVDVPVEIAVSQLNEFFHGIELATLLRNVEQLLEEHTEKPIYKRLVIDTTPEPYFEIIYRSANHNDPKEGLMLIRAFQYKEGKLIVKHIYFSIPQNARMKGIGRKILGLFYDQYLLMDVKHIYLTTGLKDGGAVWAKLGFKALYKNEMEDILQSAEQMLKGTEDLEDVKAVFNAYYKREPNGKSFPIRQWVDIEAMIPVLNENTWNGWIDLTNTEELRNFKSNVGR
jgi:hypothetical protein